MNKKLLIGIIVLIVLVALGAAVYFWLPRMQGGTKVAYGYSVKDSETEAVAEAVSMIKAKLPDPDYVIMYSTVEEKLLGMKGYNPETVLKEVNRLLPNTKVYGGTSFWAVFNNKGYLQGKNAALTMLAISSPRIKFGVGGVNIKDYTSLKEAGKAAVQNAIKNAGKEGEYPQLVLMTGSMGNEEGLVLGIEEVIGWGIPIIGGSAASDAVSSPIWMQFANDKGYNNGISITAVFTDLDIGYAYEAGFEKQEPKGIITKAEGRTIYEIDNRLAGDVFNEWCGGCIAEQLETGGSIMLGPGKYWSLAKAIKSESETYYLSFYVYAVGANKSLLTAANVAPSEEVFLTHGDPGLFVDKLQKTTEKAMSSKDIKKGEPLFGISVSCAGLYVLTPEADRLKLPAAISAEIGENVPFIGAFTAGEQGPLGVVNHHGNLIDSIVIFSE